MKIPKTFVPEKDLEDITGKLMNESVKLHPNYTKFEIISAKTYAKCIAKLKEQGQKPFTFAENIEARIIDYKANDKNSELFKTYLDSVTGIAYKANSTKFKIILRSDKLENINSYFEQSFIAVDYDAEQGIELDSRKGEYNQVLTRKEAKNHEFWIEVMNGDKEKLAKYVDIWFDKAKMKNGRGVYLKTNTSMDELRALALCGDGYSYAGGLSLRDDTRFVSGA